MFKWFVFLLVLHLGAADQDSCDVANLDENLSVICGDIDLYTAMLRIAEEDYQNAPPKPKVILQKQDKALAALAEDEEEKEYFAQKQEQIAQEQEVQGAAVRETLTDADLDERLSVIYDDMYLYLAMLRIAEEDYQNAPPKPEVISKKQDKALADFAEDVVFKKHVLERAQKDYDAAVAEQRKKASQGNAVNGQELESAKVLGFKKVLEGAQSSYDAAVAVQKSPQRSAKMLELKQEKKCFAQKQEQIRHEQEVQERTLRSRFNKFTQSRRFLGFSESGGKITQTQKTVLYSLVRMGVCDAEQNLDWAQRALDRARERYYDAYAHPQKIKEYSDQIRAFYEEKTADVLKWVLCGNADYLPGSAAEFLRLHWKNQDLNAVNGQELESAKVLGFKKVLEGAQSSYDAAVAVQKSPQRSAKMLELEEEKEYFAQKQEQIAQEQEVQGAAVRETLTDADLDERLSVIYDDMHLYLAMLRIAEEDYQNALPKPEVISKKQDKALADFAEDVVFRKHVLERAQKDYDASVAEQRKKALQGNAVNGQEQENVKVLGFKKVLESAQSSYDAAVAVQKSPQRSAKMLELEEEKKYFAQKQEQIAQEQEVQEKTLRSRFNKFTQSRFLGFSESGGKITQTQKTVLYSLVRMGVCDAEQNLDWAKRELDRAHDRYYDAYAHPQKIKEYSDQIRAFYEEKTADVLKWVLCGNADYRPGSAAALAQEFLRLHLENQDLFVDVEDRPTDIQNTLGLFMEGFLSEMDERTRRNICNKGADAALGLIDLSLESNNSLEGSAVALIYAVLVNSGSRCCSSKDLASVYQYSVKPKIRPSILEGGCDFYPFQLSKSQEDCAKIYTFGQKTARYLT